mmetsp:Transcript_60494/g.128245  ORF Transcript_60494/g.128245 Transcript_60494/m.128245 type:complete len:486 (-) Transcript_60494:53-1510(-)
MDGLRIEMQKTMFDMRNTKFDWKKFGRRALPVAALGLAATAALCAKKQSSPPNPALLQTRLRFQCQPASTWEKKGMLPSPASLEKSLKAAGLKPSEILSLRRAAQRLRGPIEKDIVDIETKCQAARETGGDASSTCSALYREAVATWRQKGYFEEPQEFERPRSVGELNIITQEDESYGRDIGCPLPLLLTRTVDCPIDPQCLGAAQTEACADALEANGVVLLGNILARPEVQALRDRFQLQISALDQKKTKDGSFPPVRTFIPEALEAEDPDLVVVQSTTGRHHYILRGRPLEMAVSAAQAGAVPVLWTFLERAARAAGLPEDSRPYISEVQLLVSDPCAVDQFWHVDNTAPGLTLFIPLTEVPEDLGPTLFHPGSQWYYGQVPGSSSVFSRLSNFASSFLSSEGVMVGAMGAGDGLLYDSRIIHRGAINKRYDRTRVALVFRYDFKRPPGIGVVGSQVLSWAGNSLALFQSFYSKLPSGDSAK